MTLVVTMTVAMVLVTFTQVIFRGALNSPLAWSEEVARYLFVWIVFIGGAWTVSGDGHFRMDFLLSASRGRYRQALVWLSCLCMILFAVVMLVYGISLMFSVASQISAALRITMSIPYAALPISGLLIIIHALEFAVRASRQPEGGE
jgi:TRAP-type C4-dicarboxylate transport system permease small subunit